MTPLREISGEDRGEEGRGELSQDGLSRIADDDQGHKGNFSHAGIEDRVIDRQRDPVRHLRPVNVDDAWVVIVVT